MVVSVQFYGIQRKLTHASEIEIPLLDEACVTDVVRYLKERYPELPLSETGVLVSVNNQISTMDQVLETNDKIAFIPHIGGG